MKKVISILLAVVLLFCVFVCTAFAVEPRWTNIASIEPGITSGTYYATVEGLSGTTKIDCTLVLYKKGLFGIYSEVSRASSSYSGKIHTFSGSYTVASGKTYKVEATTAVTRNGVTESATASSVKSF